MALEQLMIRLADGIDLLNRNLSVLLERIKPASAPAQASTEPKKPPVEVVIAYDRVRNAVLKYAENYGMPAAVAFLAQFHDANGLPCRSAKDIQVSDYHACIEASLKAPTT